MKMSFSSLSSFDALSFLRDFIFLCTILRGVQSAFNPKSPTTSTQKCLDLAQSILNRNSPEFVLIPDDSGYNTFITTSVKVNVNWLHIHKLLDSTCIQSYLLEYRQRGEYGKKQSSDDHRRISKRETSANDARISPPIQNDKTNYVISLPDDCEVYSVSLVLVPKSGAGGQLLYSNPQQFWPAAHRTSVESFSDAIFLSWPPICTYMTKEWRLEICDIAQDDCNVQTLEGNSPTHILRLKSCHSFQLRLLASTDSNSQSDESSSGNVLWTFNKIHTLPKPNFDLKAGHKSLNIQIQQLGCQPGVQVAHWRITHCRHTHNPETSHYKNHHDDSAANEYTLNLDKLSEDGSGEGRDHNTMSDIDDEEEYYYYDHEEMNSCINSQYKILDNDIVKLDNLDTCTLYSIDITPTDPGGKILQPGEQYGTIHSTLCGDQDSENNFWFKEDNRGKLKLVIFCKPIIAFSRSSIKQQKLKHFSPAFMLPRFWRPLYRDKINWK